MIQQIAIKTAEKMSERSIIETGKARIYAYGLELLYSSLAGVAALLIISAICGKPFLWIPYLAGFVPLRLSGGGYHAKTHFRCIFTFSFLYFLVLFTERLYPIPVKACLITCSINLVIILLFSPVAAPNKPLKESSRRIPEQPAPRPGQSAGGYGGGFPVHPQWSMGQYVFCGQQHGGTINAAGCDKKTGEEEVL